MSAALLCAALTVVSAGCSGSETSQVQPDMSVTAQFDYDQAVIHMPLDPYVFGGAYFVLSNRAVTVGVGACMRAAGFEYHAAALAAKDAPPRSGSRQFGIWSVPSAKRLGIGTPEDPVRVAMQADAAQFGGAWSAAEEKCQSNVGGTVNAMGPDDEAIGRKVATRLERESYALASGTAQWKNAKAAWGSCLSKAGLTPRSVERAWTSAESSALVSSSGYVKSPPSAESIRLGVIEATCNTETRMAEQMANLQAAYEGALIKGKEATLAQEKDELQKATAVLEQYIAKQQA